MLKVLYDHQAFTAQTFSGVSKSFCELITNLPKFVKPTLSVRCSNNFHLIESGIIPNLQPASLDEKIFVSRGFYFPGKGKIYSFLSKTGLLSTAEKINSDYSIKSLKEQNFDVFHPTFFDSYFLKYLGDRPFVLTVHDMMPELFPQYYGKHYYQIEEKKKLVNKAAAIIAVSNNTKMDLINILNVPEEKVHVVYHGGPKEEIIQDERLVNEKYFLYVGTRNYYKNFFQTLKDFAILFKKYPDMQLICTGPDFNTYEQNQIRKYNLEDKVKHYFVDDKGLKNLYAYALAMVYPSLYEGFGMPILEAFAYGCPVLLNRKSCFPEIAADAAIYFESDGLKSNLPYILERFLCLNEQDRLNIVKKGRDRLACFSWEKSAEQLALLYKSLL